MSAKLQGQQDPKPLENPKITGEAFGAPTDNDEWIDYVDDTPDAVSDDLPWRRRLAKWPDLWRERWGRRANALEEGGVPWVEAERQAWNEVLAEKRQAESSVVAVVARTQTQGRFRATG